MLEHLTRKSCETSQETKGRKAKSQILPDGTPTHCFTTLMENLAFVVLNKCRLKTPVNLKQPIEFEMITLLSKSKTSYGPSTRGWQSKPCHIKIVDRTCNLIFAKYPCYVWLNAQFNPSNFRLNLDLTLVSI